MKSIAERIVPLHRHATCNLTAAQALVQYLAAQYTVIDGREVPLFAGIWAIFGHGNVAGLGEALYDAQDSLPTWRGHNEQSMAHAAIAYAKAHNRRRMMAVTSSVGPGATNMVTAAALAHVNRLPVLFLPGDVYASRRPDPVLQQVEDFGDATVSANDSFRAVSRFWDRITRPEQLMDALPKALRILTDPADCGPVTLCLPQDVQAETYDFPASFFEKRVWHVRAQGPDEAELAAALAALKGAQKPLIVAGGGVKYALATQVLREFADQFGIPACDTQAGKGSLPWDHPRYAGSIGVTGAAAANDLAAQADVVLAVGTRLQDFTTGSRTLFENPDVQLIQLNVCAFDAFKHNALPLVADAGKGLTALSAGLKDWRAPAPWTAYAQQRAQEWNNVVTQIVAPAANDRGLPSDAQVLGAVNRAAGDKGIVVAAAGGLPGELHKLWRAQDPVGYHLEYGYSCMGYEIAGGLGAKMAHPQREVYVMLGDGSYLMMNSELATSVSMGHKLVVVLTDNRGFGCINRLQKGCGQKPHNNLLDETTIGGTAHNVDFVAHAASMGARAVKVRTIADLEEAIKDAQRAERTSVIVIETDPQVSTGAGGHPWDVAVAQTSVHAGVRKARRDYETFKKKQH